MAYPVYQMAKFKERNWRKALLEILACCGGAAGVLWAIAQSKVAKPLIYDPSLFGPSISWNEWAAVIALAIPAGILLWAIYAILRFSFSR